MTAAVILASGSAIRRTLLAASGLRFECLAPRIDEAAVRAALAADHVAPRDQADALAEMKALKVADRHPGAMVIGCDQVLDLDGSVLAKPESPEALRGQLALLSGRSHKLHSAAVICEEARPVWRHVGTARLTMHRLSAAFIADYVDRNWESVRHCVGGYRLEAEGVRLFSRLDGGYHDVLGLPLVELLSYLTLRGVLET